MNELEIDCRLLQINGHGLYVEKTGKPDGLPVLLLHHGLGAVQSWKAQVPALACAGYRVVTYDRWGYGKSDPRPALQVPGFEPDLQDLYALLDRLELEQVVLAGHSDGGTIALYFAIQHPERVCRLVTVAAHIYVEAKMLPGIQEVCHLYETQDGFRASLGRLHGEKTDKVFYNWFNGWVSPGNESWDMRSLLEQVRCPALVVQGLEDEHAKPQHAEDLVAAIPGAEMWLAPGVGHMLPQDIPEEFNRRLLAFLR